MLGIDIVVPDFAYLHRTPGQNRRLILTPRP